MIADWVDPVTSQEPQPADDLSDCNDKYSPVFIPDRAAVGGLRRQPGLRVRVCSKNDGRGGVKFPAGESSLGIGIP